MIIEQNSRLEDNSGIKISPTKKQGLIAELDEDEGEKFSINLNDIELSKE